MRGTLTRAPPPINGARSVMATRQERDSSRDDFYTPPWATRALCEVIFPHLEILPALWSAWEPACGEGHMAEVLKEYFGHVFATDIHDYSYGARGDFLRYQPMADIDWIITNPPFRGSAKPNEPRSDRALEFTLRALGIARVGVAMFVRTQWSVEGRERYEKLFEPHPPTLSARFIERVGLCKGRWDPDCSTATSYSWLIWIKGREPMREFWIPAGQKRALTKPDDRARFAAWTYVMAPKALKIWRRPHWEEKDAFDEIARRLGVSTGTARNLVRFGLKLERGEEAIPQQEAAE